MHIACIAQCVIYSEKNKQFKAFAAYQFQDSLLDVIVQGVRLSARGWRWYDTHTRTQTTNWLAGECADDKNTTLSYPILKICKVMSLQLRIFKRITALLCDVPSSLRVRQAYLCSYNIRVSHSLCYLVCCKLDREVLIVASKNLVWMTNLNTVAPEELTSSMTETTSI